MFEKGISPSGGVCRKFPLFLQRAISLCFQPENRGSQGATSTLLLRAAVGCWHIWRHAVARQKHLFIGVARKSWADRQDGAFDLDSDLEPILLWAGERCWTFLA